MRSQSRKVFPKPKAAAENVKNSLENLNAIYMSAEV
jgi:hypothetical protein